jgi:hypothetical protein
MTEVRGQKSEDRLENSEVGMRKSERQRTEAEDRILNAEVGMGKSEYGQVTGGRRQRRTEDRRQITEDR